MDLPCQSAITGEGHTLKLVTYDDELRHFHAMIPFSAEKFSPNTSQPFDSF